MPVVPKEIQVGRESALYQGMVEGWSRIDDLKGGTTTMRLAGVKWLPRFPSESVKAYKSRLNRTFLYGAYKDTTAKLASKPFSKKVTVEKVPEDLVEIEGNVDRIGTDLTSFASEVFEAAIDYGLTHILIDYPQIPAGATLEDERKLGARPTFIHVKPTQLIGWQAQGTGSGIELTQIRIREIREEDDGDFGTIFVKYVRVWTKESWQLWKAVSENKSGKDERYELTESGDNPLGVVPLVTLYFNRTGFMTADPTLDELAWLNINHWQSSSDQNNILGFSRFGMWFASGFSEEEQKKSLEVGPNRLIASANEEADFKVVEGTGAAVQAGERDLRAIEQRMEVLGLQPFVQRTGVETATGKSIHESKTESAIQTWVRRTAEAFDRAYVFAAKWNRTTLPDDFAVNIFNDFGVSMRSDVDMRLLLDAALSGKITDRTWLDEAKRRGTLRESLDVDKEIEEVRKQTTNLINAGLSAGGGGDINDPAPEPEVPVGAQQ